jgi:HEAT repeat protein
VIPALIEALKDRDGDVRRWAMELLGEFGPEAREAVPALIQLLKSPVDQEWAMGILGRIGPDARDAVPALTEVLLKHPNAGVRKIASDALGKITPEPGK